MAETRSVTTVSWQCADPVSAEVVARRADLVATASRRVVSEPAVLWGAVLGFRLHGFDGGASSAVPEGPASDSCPAGPWALVLGSTQTTEEAGRPVLAMAQGSERRVIALP